MPPQRNEKSDHPSRTIALNVQLKIKIIAIRVQRYKIKSTLLYDSLKNQVKLNHIKAVHSRSSPLYGEEDGRDVRMIYIYLQ